MTTAVSLVNARHPPHIKDVASVRTHQMLHGPVLQTLLRLATPNVLGLFAMTIVIGYDGFILGRARA